MKKVGLFIFVAALAMLVGAMPAFAGKKALNEDDLELITAAGQPEVLIAASAAVFGATSTILPSAPVTKLLSQNIELVLADQSQQGLRALVLNNVVGENEVASGVNISASPSGAGTSAQTNIVNQSWGSTLDVGGSSATASTIDISGKCVACLNTAGGTASGGHIDVSGKAVATTNVAGGGAASRRSIYADEIIIGSVITKTDLTDMELILTGNAQQNLAALIVNNVSGLNLVANALNIASGNITLGGASAGIAGSSISSALTQDNTVRQYRGTPFISCATAACAR